MDGPVPVSWRLLIEEAASGAWNMAVDEAVLERYATSTAPLSPTLRLYGWDPPALSLGKAQTIAGGPDLRYLRGEGIDLVRRPTGGRAVLHARERTYSVCGMVNVDPFRSGIGGTYLQIAEALRRGLNRLGVPAVVAPARPRRRRREPGAACFDLTSTYEITVSGRKLVGSAQLRRRSAFVQHGSILIRGDDRLARALDSDVRHERVTDLASCLGRTPSRDEIDQALSAGFAAHFDVELHPRRLEASECRTATRLYSWKYLSAAWTLDGKSGERERHWSGLG